MTRLQDILGTELPIIQAPMAGVQGNELAIAVSQAGGLGSLPCAMLDIDTMVAEIEAIQSQTEAFNVNFFCHQLPFPDLEQQRRWRNALLPYFREFNIDPETIPGGNGRVPFSAEHVRALADLKPPVVSFHFGLPDVGLVAEVKRWGARILASATTVEEAVWLEASGVDVIIAQGLEAGGHRGCFLSDDLTRQMGTFALVPQVVAAVDIPVVAAGGIASAAQMRSVLELGAAGVQVGTSYLLCPEATTSAIHRTALASPKACHTAITNVFTGRPARSIVNRLISELGPMSNLVPHFPLAASTLAPLRAAAEQNGSGDFSPLWAGQNTSGCQSISAAALTRFIASET
jgi:nitronate monooxygenase